MVSHACKLAYVSKCVVLGVLAQPNDSREFEVCPAFGFLSELYPVAAEMPHPGKIEEGGNAVDCDQHSGGARHEGAERHA